MMRSAVSITLKSLILIALVFLLPNTPAFGQEEGGLVRFVHVIPDAPAIDIYTDGQLTVNALAFGEASGYIRVPDGDHEITVTPSGSQTPLWQQNISTTSNPQTLIASSPGDPSFVVYEDNLRQVNFGNTRFLLIHAIADAPDIDVVLLSDNSRIAQDIPYLDSFGTFDIPADFYNMAIVPADDDVASAIIPDLPLPLENGLSNIAVIYGTFDNPQGLLLSAATSPNDDFGLVRFAHGVSGAPAVEVVIDDTVIVPNLAVGRPTEHIPLPAGTHDLELRANDQSVLSTEFTVEPGSATTAAAIGTLERFDLLSFSDDLDRVSPQTATIRVINTIPNSTDLTITLADGTILAQGLSVGEASAAVDISPSNQAINMTLTINDRTETVELPSVILNGGVYYNLLVIAEEEEALPTLALAPTTINQNIASAPGSDGTAIAAVESVVEDSVTQEETPAEDIAPSTEDTAPSVEDTAPSIEDTAPSVEDTAPSQDEAPLPDEPESSEPSQSPEVAQPSPTPQPTPARVFDEDVVATARVLVDPGANLNLRQYPTRDSLVLASLPSGTTLQVRGREGAPEIIEGIPTPLDNEDFIDPVLELLGLIEIERDESETDEAGDEESDEVIVIEISEEQLQEALLDFQGDITPSRIWLNVIFKTPDGGEITGWINAAFAEVRDLSGDRQRLINLPTYPRNFFGVARNTTISPPTAASAPGASAIVINIDPGAFLNIRRTPEADGEVLDRMAPGTVVELLGTTPDEDWVFIEYRPQSGGSVTGWVDARFVRFEYRQQRATIESLLSTDVIQIFDEERRGTVAATTQSSVSAPTPDPIRNAVVAEVILDPGASLHLRRSPSTDAESLNLIPSGTRLIIDRRTSDNQWLRATFEQQVGWIAARFVGLTFNGIQISAENTPLEVEEIAPEATEEPEGSEEPIPEEPGQQAATGTDETDS